MGGSDKKRKAISKRFAQMTKQVSKAANRLKNSGRSTKGMKRFGMS